MIILKTIGAFFVKIWRWIKETAWVQPLLIVGAIFAIIFSIPSITSWAGSWSGNNTDAFYTSVQKSLEGEKTNVFSVSPADQLTDFIDANRFGITQSDEDFKKSSDIYGKKFFFVFVKTNCDGCSKAEGGFRFLRDNWGKYGLNPSNNSYGFKVWSVFASETSSNDDDYDDQGSPSAFNRYLETYSDLFNTVGPTLKDAPYKSRAKIEDDTNYNAFSLDSGTSTTSPLAAFPVPSICLVDYSDEAIAAGRAGLSEIVFSLTGDTDAEKANFLMNMWNHVDAYSVDNLFTKVA